VRFTDAFVDKVLSAQTASASLSDKGKSIEGRPCYPPNCLFKLLIYGYFDTVPKKPALPTRVTPMKNRLKNLNGQVLSAPFRFPTNPK
jgi:hypothetical protein